MAKGLQKHQARQEKLSLLGKDLARRSSRKCELCHTAGVSLKAVEVTEDSDPSLDSCLFICETCENQLFNPKQRDEEFLRCLNNSIWSETLLVQATALTLLNQLESDWAQNLAEQVYLFDELEALVAEVNKKITAS